MDKQDRLIAIREIISSEEISSQEELLMKLEGRGIQCTQATLSRNLRQLRVSRIPGSGGKMRYILDTGNVTDNDQRDINDVSLAVNEMIWARNMMLIKTRPGYAAAVASHIDRSSPTEIAGTIAGDDTILVVPFDKYSEKTVRQVLRKLFPL